MPNSEPFQNVLRQIAPLPAPVEGALARILQLETLDRMYDHLRAHRREETFAADVLASLGVSVGVDEDDLAKIPKTGPVVIMANHPFGMIEGALLTGVLRRVRPDAKIMSNYIMGLLPELRDDLILVNPFGRAAGENSRGVRAAGEWLERGGLLAVFPAGEVSHLDLRRRGVADPVWHATAARLALRAKAKVVPVYFEGANSAWFQLAGLLHPKLRTALLPHELLNKRNRCLEVRIGHPVPGDGVQTGEVRSRTYWLAERAKAPPSSPHAGPRSRPRKLAPACETVPGEWIREEILALPPGRKLAAGADLEVWLARASELPMGLREIGRLREITFRAAGEGTGRACDLDRFDSWYKHLVLWNRQSHEIAGSYRLCGNDRNVELYSSTLFKFSPRFFAELGPALELGRSFIRTEYQRSYQPLLLLWRAIGEYVAHHPQYRHLFGPVSISADYSLSSRTLIASYLKSNCFDADLARLIGAWRPFRTPQSRHFPTPVDIDDLDLLVQDIEPHRKGLPVLVRQYLKLGGRLCAFHVDSSFGQCLDGLVVVDLLRTERRLVERYLGAAGAAGFYSRQAAINACPTMLRSKHEKREHSLRNDRDRHRSGSPDAIRRERV